MSSGTTALSLFNVDRNSVVLTGAYESMAADASFAGKEFVDVPLFPGDFLLLYLTFLVFMKTWRLVFPKQPSEAVPVTPAPAPYRPLSGGFNDRSGVIDLFTGMKVAGLMVLLTFVFVFLANMATTFSVYFSPVIVLLAYPFKVLGYHNMTMALFLASVVGYFFTLFVVGIRKFAF